MTRYIVTGMSCAACSARVEKAVRRVKGVTGCSVSLLTNSMSVEGQARREDVIAAVKAAGYGASPAEENGQSEKPAADPLADTQTPVLKRRLIASVGFLAVLMYISMGHMMWGWPLPPFFDNNHVAMGLLQLLLTVVIMVINQKFFISGYKSLWRRSPNMDTLVALGSTAAFGYSTFALFAMTDAQAYKNATWVVGDAGCGKTTAAIEYRRTHRNVFYILCSEDMKKSDFVREIAKQAGAPIDGTNLRDVLEYAVSVIAFLNNPLIIFDEGDKLTDSVFSYFISIYNRLENKSGIIFLSTDYIKRRLENGLRYNKKGYKEINSRIGRMFFDINVATEQDVYTICQANGLTEPTEIKRVMREAEKGEYDLRRVKRVVHACKRILEAKRLGGKQV